MKKRVMCLSKFGGQYPVTDWETSEGGFAYLDRLVRALSEEVKTGRYWVEEAPYVVPIAEKVAA